MNAELGAGHSAGSSTKAPTSAPSATTRLAAVVGHPVGHSLSPTIHNAAFAAASADWTFVALDVPADAGDRIVGAMRTLGIAGLAVTTPHKQVVAASVDAVDPAAEALDSVNTVVRRPDGTTFGASTDGAGFVASLAEAGHDVTGLAVAILGAGAAARSVIDALSRSGVREIAVLNRTPRAAEQAASLAPCARVGTPADVSTADLVVNATTVGMGEPPDRGELPIDPGALSAGQVVADLVYHPLETALLAAARAAGAHAVDGLGMLVHQAALQQRLWTGETPDVAVMRAAALDELARRARPA